MGDGGKAMKSIFKTSPIKAVLILLLACGFIFGGVQTTRAALSITSGVYTAEAGMQSVGINIVENGTVVGDGVLKLGKPDGEDFRYGKTYKEELAVEIPSGSIAQYVRVIVTKYWKVEDGKADKLFEADPESIEIGYTTGNGWSAPQKSASGERDILYYLTAVGPGQRTTPFTSTLKADGELKLVETRETEQGTVYIFDGMEFVVEVEAQGVQTHNAKDAMTSAWGADAAALVNPKEG